MPLVEFDHVRKVYRRGKERMNIRAALPGRLGYPTAAGGDEHVALADLSFTLDAGQSIGFIGPNGAGKSTTLKLVAGVTAPTSGTVRINGRTASLIELGAGFHPEMTGRENLFFSAAVLGMGPATIRRRLDEIIDFADIGPYLDSPVKRYSSGMLARLGFAVATHLDAEVLVLDEVLAVGDAGFQRKCHQRIEKLSRSGVALLYVTHAMWTVPMLCDEAILLTHGCVAQRGEPADVVRHYEAMEAGRVLGPPSGENGSGRLQATAVSPARILTGDAILAEAEVVTDRPLPAGTVKVMIADRFRRVYATTSSFDDGVSFDRAGTHRITCRLDRLPLQPGRYVVYLAFFGDAAVPVVDDQRQFDLEVEGPAVDPAYGVLRVPAAWEQG